MNDPSRLSTELLHATAPLTGSQCLQALVDGIAAHYPGCQAVIGSQPEQPSQQVRIVHSNLPHAAAGYAITGQPCEQVLRSGQPLRQQAAQAAASPLGGVWRDYAGWPLYDSSGTSLGVLSLFSPQCDSFDEQLLASVAPFARRAGAELQRQQQDEARQLRMHWHELHSGVLRQYLDGQQPLPELLAGVVDQIEQQYPAWLCAIVLLDDQQRMRPLAAPSLPAAYNSILHGMAIGPAVGSCGAAAWRGQRVVAENLQQHPYWAPYRDIAARFDLGSCWSEPIIDSKGKVHGTFAVYQHQPATPTPQAITMLEECARLLAVLMENSEIRRSLDSRTSWYQAVLQNSADAFSIIDMEGRFLEVSDCLCQMLGYSQEELLAMHLWQVVPNSSPELICQRLASTLEGGETFDSVNRHRDGHLLEIEVCARRLLLDGKPVVLGSARDIGERKALERQLLEQASTDMLTGIANRRHFLLQLDQAAAQATAPLTLWMLDLDHFKQVNDRYGHDCGDHVLTHFAALLCQQLPAGALAGRLGGEEFAVLLPGIPLAAAQQYAEKLQQQLRQQPLHYQQQSVALTVSIGATAQRDGEDSHGMMMRADQALYQAKHAGRNRCIALP
ncbi:sensor domain-containing diguanylate cyclase [Vogesella oryzae]|uniref:sensor domain-containing diguanylate cyclase n=1 Tax=Vogesella oryzae TaxID=1735285 RepID=UPI0015840BB4|nr:diguanylate cyclase [Vogesella oryzae]